MKKSWKDNNRLREDFAQDKKEYKYLNSFYNKKYNAKSQKEGEYSDEKIKVVDEIISKLNDIFKKNNCENFNVGTEERYGTPYVILYYNGNAEFNMGYATTFFDNTKDNFEYTKNKIIGRIFERELHWVKTEKDINDVQKTLDNLKGLATDFNKEIKPLFDKGRKALDKQISVIKSQSKFNGYDVSKAYNRAEKSYKEEHPVAPGEVVRWKLQNGNEKTVEVISIDDSTQTAKVKTDGGSMRKVPLSRLEPDVIGNLGYYGASN